MTPMAPVPQAPHITRSDLKYSLRNSVVRKKRSESSPSVHKAGSSIPAPCETPGTWEEEIRGSSYMASWRLAWATWNPVWGQGTWGSSNQSRIHPGLQGGGKGLERLSQKQRAVL